MWAVSFFLSLVFHGFEPGGRFSVPPLFDQVWSISRFWQQSFIYSVVILVGPHPPPHRLSFFSLGQKSGCAQTHSTMVCWIFPLSASCKVFSFLVCLPLGKLPETVFVSISCRTPRSPLLLFFSTGGHSVSPTPALFGAPFCVQAPPPAYVLL